MSIHRSSTDTVLAAELSGADRWMLGVWFGWYIRGRMDHERKRPGAPKLLAVAWLLAWRLLPELRQFYADNGGPPATSSPSEMSDEEFQRDRKRIGDWTRHAENAARAALGL